MRELKLLILFTVICISTGNVWAQTQLVNQDDSVPEIEKTKDELFKEARVNRYTSEFSDFLYSEGQPLYSDEMLIAAKKQYKVNEEVFNKLNCSNEDVFVSDKKCEKIADRLLLLDKKIDDYFIYTDIPDVESVIKTCGDQIGIASEHLLSTEQAIEEITEKMECEREDKDYMLEAFPELDKNCMIFKSANLVFDAIGDVLPSWVAEYILGDHKIANLKAATNISTMRGPNGELTSEARRMKQCLENDNPSCVGQAVYSGIKQLFSGVEAMGALLKSGANILGNVVMHFGETVNSTIEVVNKGYDSFMNLLDHPDGFFNVLSKKIYNNLEGVFENFVRYDLGCRRWDGTPHFSKCIVPSKPLSCLPSDQLKQMMCSLVGTVIGTAGGVTLLIKGGAKLAGVLARKGKGDDDDTPKMTDNDAVESARLENSSNEQTSKTVRERMREERFKDKSRISFKNTIQNLKKLKERIVKAEEKLRQDLKDRTKKNLGAKVVGNLKKAEEAFKNPLVVIGSMAKKSNSIYAAPFTFLERIKGNLSTRVRTYRSNKASTNHDTLRGEINQTTRSSESINELNNRPKPNDAQSVTTSGTTTGQQQSNPISHSGDNSNKQTNQSGSNSSSGQKNDSNKNEEENKNNAALVAAAGALTLSEPLLNSSESAEAFEQRMSEYHSKPEEARSVSEAMDTLGIDSSRPVEAQVNALEREMGKLNNPESYKQAVNQFIQTERALGNNSPDAKLRERFENRRRSINQAIADLKKKRAIASNSRNNASEDNEEYEIDEVEYEDVADNPSARNAGVASSDRVDDAETLDNSTSQGNTSRKVAARNTLPTPPAASPVGFSAPANTRANSGSTDQGQEINYNNPVNTLDQFSEQINIDENQDGQDVASEEVLTDYQENPEVVRLEDKEDILNYGDLNATLSELDGEANFNEIQTKLLPEVLAELDLETKDEFLKFIEEKFPKLKKKFEELWAKEKFDETDGYMTSEFSVYDKQGRKTIYKELVFTNITNSLTKIHFKKLPNEEYQTISESEYHSISSVTF